MVSATDLPASKLYNKFGLKPFFKEVSFGIRMSYSTSFPVFNAKSLNFSQFMQHSFAYNYEKFDEPYGLNGLKKIKSLFGIRPYQTPAEEIDDDEYLESYKLVRELQIPIVEIERAIISQEGTGGFTIDDGSEIFSMDELGHWFGHNAKETWNNINVDNLAGEFEDLPPEFFMFGDGLEIYKFLTKTPDQFFYKNLASEMLTDLKNSPEFRLMYDHLFPMRKYMALSFVYAGEGLSKFISEPTDVLDLTKESIKAVWENLVSSADYKHLPSSVSSMMEDYLMRSQGGTAGKEPDMTKQILEIIYKTPLLILKGFVEITDPAVMIAKTVIDIAMMIQQTTISAIEQSLKTAKQIAQAAIDASRMTIDQIKVKAGIDLAQLNVFNQTLQTSPTVPQELKDKITIENTDQDLENWKISAPGGIQQYEADMSDIDKSNWLSFKQSRDNIQSFKKDFAEANKKLETAEADLEEIDIQINTTLADAKKVMKDIFDSPYLLPGMWFALLPSMIPYGGGIVPPPFPGGPPSTVPGMIYIALLLIDAIEEKTHNDLQKTKEPNCDNEL